MTDPEAIDRSLAMARTARWAPPEAKARVRAKLAASVGMLGTAPADGMPGRGTLPSWTARLASLTKRGTLLWVGAAFAAGYWLGWFRAGANAAATAAAPASIATAQPLPIDPVRLVPARGAPGALAQPELPATAAPVAPPPLSPRSARAARRAPSKESSESGIISRGPSEPPDPFSDELALLARSERAIRAGEPALALALLDELEARHPDSRLSEERSAARILAECALSAPAAKRRAELFLRDRRASMYTDRMRHMCALDVATPGVVSPEQPGADGSAGRGH